MVRYILTLTYLSGVLKAAESRYSKIEQACLVFLFAVKANNYLN